MEEMVENKAPKKSVKKNFVYNLIYQILVLIIPIVVTPYVSRILLSDGVGQYSFSTSIVYYFSLFAALGFGYYAQREIAKVQDNKAKQSKIFWEIVIVRLVSSLVAFGALIGLIQIPYFADYKTLLYILSLTVLAVSIDVSFVFQGNEDFKMVALIGLISKVIVVALVFIFIKVQSDLWKYTLINAISPILTAVMMWPFLKKYLVPVKFFTLNPWKHLGPCLRLFVPTIAISVYTMLDKTMIGLLIPGTTTVIKNGVETTVKISDLENGYYNQAEKIIKMFVTVVTSLGTVMIPRNSFFFANHEEEKGNENVKKGLRFAYFLALPLMFGVIAVANNFSPWFFGDGYEKVPLLMMVFSPLILAIGLNNVYGVQYLISSGKDKIFTISVTIGAAINICLNSFLIYYYQSVGAAIASVCAEFSILIFQMIYCRKTFKISSVLLMSWKYVVASLVMFIPCYFMGVYLSSSILNTFLIVLVGVVVYALMLLLLKDSFLLSIIGQIKNKFRTRFSKQK
jgi:O-antigen/teichoic acid export membrane protein